MLKSLKFDSYSARTSQESFTSNKAMWKEIIDATPKGYTFKYLRKNWTRTRPVRLASVTAFYEKMKK